MPHRSEYEEEKRRNINDEQEQNLIGPDDTVYRYLCPLKKIGSIIGIGGDIAKQLREQTHAKIRIGETIPGCDERVVTIYSTNHGTNRYGDEAVSPAQDALFRVHDKVVDEGMPLDDEFDRPQMVTVHLLVSSDQISCVIGKGGNVIQSIRNDTQAQIRILGTDRVPPCALSSDELVQITGDTTVVKKALYQIAFRLHDNPSRSQHLLLSSPSIYRSGIAFHNPKSGGSLVPATSIMVPYGNYKNGGRDWSSTQKEFMVRLVCPTENVGALIGKGGSFIKQIRQESGAYIVVDSSNADEDDCIVSISAKEIFEYPSRTIDAAILLQPRCSGKIERETGKTLIVTRLVVPRSNIGCVIGKGGAIIKELRNATRASIRIFSDENIPRVAADDDEMVQITGDLAAARNALLQVMQRLQANLFEIDGNSSSFPTTVPYPPTSMGVFDGPRYANDDNRVHRPAYSAYPGGYNSKTLPVAENYRVYEGPQVANTSGYQGYGVYPAGHSSGARSHGY